MNSSVLLDKDTPDLRRAISTLGAVEVAGYIQPRGAHSGAVYTVLGICMPHWAYSFSLFGLLSPLVITLFLRL